MWYISSKYIKNKKIKINLNKEIDKKTTKEIFFLLALTLTSVIFIYFWDYLRNEEVIYFLAKIYQNFIENNSSYIELLSFYFSFIGVELFFIFWIFPIIFWMGEEKTGKKAVLSLLLAVFVTFLFRQITSLPRPYFPEIRTTSFGKSFPSGHITQIISVFGFLSFYYKKPILWIITILFVFLVGMSRLFYARHFVDDLIGGVIISIFLVYFLVKLFEWLEKKKVNFSLIVFYLITITLPFTSYFFTGNLARHNYLLFYLGGISAGVILENNYLKKYRIDKFKTNLERTALGLAVSLPFAINSINLRYLVDHKDSLFYFITYFIFGIFVTFFWPFLFHIFRNTFFIGFNKARNFFS